jgi:hypothetical protein
MFGRGRTLSPSEGSVILFLCRRAGPLVAVWHAMDMGRDVTAGFHEG